MGDFLSPCTLTLRLAPTGAPESLHIHLPSDSSNTIFFTFGNMEISDFLLVLARQPGATNANIE